MVKFVHRISDVNGLHARNAMRLVQGARTLNCRIHVDCKGRRADACQIMELMGLAARYGDELIFSIEGEQERKGEETLKKLAGEIL